MPTVPIWAAFGAGLLSLLSPCVLPLLPAYVGFLSGVGGRQGGASEGDRKTGLLSHALLFVLGFTVVFVLLGASASALGRVLLRYQDVVQRIAGLFVFTFGLQTAGFVSIPFLERTFQWRVDTRKTKERGAWQALLMGMAFAGGWAPCIGPILGAILTLAATGDTLAYGVGLLAVYSAGLGVPFLLFALFMDRTQGVLRFFRSHHRAVQLTSGVLLMGLGVMLFTNMFSQLARYGTFLDLYEYW